MNPLHQLPPAPQRLGRIARRQRVGQIPHLPLALKRHALPDIVRPDPSAVSLASASFLSSLSIRPRSSPIKSASNSAASGLIVNLDDGSARADDPPLQILGRLALHDFARLARSPCKSADSTAARSSATPASRCGGRLGDILLKLLPKPRDEFIGVAHGDDLPRSAEHREAAQLIQHIRQIGGLPIDVHRCTSAGNSRKIDPPALPAATNHRRRPVRKPASPLRLNFYAMPVDAIASTNASCALQNANAFQLATTNFFSPLSLPKKFRYTRCRGTTEYHRGI
jgi:hypothetical protein